MYKFVGIAALSGCCEVKQYLYVISLSYFIPLENNIKTM
jgi:hypothetical protein